MDEPEYREKTTDLTQVTDKLYHINEPEYREKTTDLTQVTDKLYHINLSNPNTSLFHTKRSFPNGFPWRQVLCFKYQSCGFTF